MLVWSDDVVYVVVVGVVGVVSCQEDVSRWLCGAGLWLQQLTAGLRKLLVLPRGGSLLRLSL